MIDYESLRPYATAIELEYLEATIKHGSQDAAARVLNKSRSTVERGIGRLKRRAARFGLSPEHGMTHSVPPGFQVKGVSTLYNQDGKIAAQWVKSREDAEQREQIMREFVAALAEDVRGLHTPTKAPKAKNDTLSAYVLGDAHIGMYAWADECGDDFDSEIAVKDIRAAIDYLINAQPASEEAMFVNVGDFLHMDNRSNLTPASKHMLDVDTRYSRVIRIAVFAIRYCIDQLLKKHKRVTVVNVSGNHDQDSANWVSLCLSMYYEREPRVVIDSSPAAFHYHRFGKVLIGITHGDKIKLDDLPSIMASHKPEMWGETVHRYWFTGHIHHKKMMEYRGCIVESFNTLAAADAYTASHGYVSKREMQALTIHQDHGIIARAQCPIDLIRKST